MDRLKRIFQCVNPDLRSSPDTSENSHNVSEMESPKNLFHIQPPKADARCCAYKQQHRASLAESQAVFEMQKQSLEKRIQYITTQIEQFDRLKIAEKVVQIEQKCEKLQEKLEILKGDAVPGGDVPSGDWVKFG